MKLPLLKGSGRRVKAVISFIFLITFIFQSHISFAADATKGKDLFKANCGSCHALNSQLVGPALKDVDQRHSNEAWLIKWIRNNQALVASGDAEAITTSKLMPSAMATFPQLTDDDIKNILAYIKEGDKVAAPVTTSGATDAGTTTGEDSSYTNILFLVVLILGVLIFLLNRINNNLRRITAEKEGEHVAAPLTFKQKLKLKSNWAIVVFFLLVIGTYIMVDNATRLGHSKDYQPDQPIAFSHKLHAGINQINCLYCHAGAEKSKVAGIPPVSTCMNCHKGVQEGQTPQGTEEIKKIYAAYENNKPIQWVKIHNLPDHVYFNHSQHVVTGKVECQKCHGPIETEDQVHQFTSLSMGWCVNCHRETGVQFTDNKYFDMFTKLHDQLKSGEIKQVTEADMGGTECQKCHY